MSENAEAILTALLGAGGGSLLTGVFTTLVNRKRAKADTDQVIISSAETTVQAALAVAAAEAARADRAEAAVQERDQKIEALMVKIEDLQTALEAVRKELLSLKGA